MATLLLLSLHELGRLQEALRSRISGHDILDHESTRVGDGRFRLLDLHTDAHAVTHLDRLEHIDARERTNANLVRDGLVPLAELLDVDLLEDRIDLSVHLGHALLVHKCTLVQHLLELRLLDRSITNIVDLHDHLVVEMAQVLDATEERVDAAALHLLLEE